MLSEILGNLVLKKKRASVETILKISGEACFGFCLVILALPSALPIPAPGYSVPFGILIIMLGLQILCGRQKPWFPTSVLNQKINLKPFKAKWSTIKKFLGFFEYFVRPRLSFLFWSQNRILALIIIACGLSMCLPIPGTNTLPALAVFLIGLSLTEKDGLMALLGSLIGLLGITITLTILWFGQKMAEILLTRFF